MKTLILPGFSIKNKVWAEEISRELSPDIESEIVYWDHWKTGVADNNWIEEKANEIVNEFKGQRVNILAKSIGTLVTVRILEKDSSSINKIIMCGIPLEDLSADDLEHYQTLKGFPKEKIIYIQNENDNHGSYNSVSEFLKIIDNGIHVISKPREDHEYPYEDEFKKFLL